MKYVIVANGPFLAKAIIEEAIGNPRKKVIALDGASIKLAEIGIKPDVILGDFDSIDEAATSGAQHKMSSYWGIREISEKVKETIYNSDKYGVEIVHTPDQDATDLQKAIKYCDSHDAESIEIVCATGGARMDHHESNVRTLSSFYKPGRPIYMYTELQTLEFVRDAEVVMPGKIGDYCGILTAPGCSFISKDSGLEWSKNEDGSPFELKYGLFESTSNKFSKNNPTVTVLGSALLIYPGRLSEQRVFEKLSEKERIKKVSDQYQYHLVETTVGELSDFKKAYKTMRDVSDFPVGTKKIKETLRVTHNKGKLKDLADDTKMLVSMSENKSRLFDFFKSDRNSFTQQVRQACEKGEVNFYKMCTK